MDFLALSLRVAAAGNTDFLPYTFDGDWSEEDRAVVEAAIKPHVPERVDSMFNNWSFYRGRMGFTATRATWNMGNIHAGTAAELAEKIEDFYAR